jgi:prepilin-type N-terminal cleavage/methylation domain-containing protein
MLNKLKKIQAERSDQKGFTIIEVMIVLAIAGLIILIVFLAVPALQRNSRNTQRKNDAARISSLISEYVSNHNGLAPTSFGTAAGNLNISGESFSIITPPTGSIVTRPATPSAPAADTAVVYSTASCTSDGTATQAATSARSLVVFYGTEGSTTTQCVNAGN